MPGLPEQKPTKMPLKLLSQLHGFVSLKLSTTYTLQTHQLFTKCQHINDELHLAKVDSQEAQVICNFRTLGSPYLVLIVWLEMQHSCCRPFTLTLLFKSFHPLTCLLFS